jgi:low temperature requirement protein LtrA
MTSETYGRFKRWFWRPPRAHGEVIADRQVSNLELFYDLVYVAVIGQAAHHLATHVSVGGVAEFAVVFALIWIAWINGSLYLELHGRQDGRTRSLVFLQMGILVLLAVFTADAAGGWGFAVVYAIYQVVQTVLWSSVWRQDRRDDSEYQGLAGGYVVGMGGSATVIGASALLAATPRLLVWAGLGVAWIVGIALAARSSRVGLGLAPTDSLVERFGLFTIIVLGEVILGVVAGLSGVERDVKTIVTGLLALWLGFGLWWIYFDLVGRRLPRAEGGAVLSWVLSHLPVTVLASSPRTRSRLGAWMMSLRAPPAWIGTPTAPPPTVKLVTRSGALAARNNAAAVPTSGPTRWGAPRPHWWIRPASNAPEVSGAIRSGRPSEWPNPGRSMATTRPTPTTRSQMRRKAHRVSGHGASSSTVVSESALVSANRTRTPSQTRK